MEDLDVEYLQLLSQIKPFIACIMNNNDIELIKMWLEKLNDEKIVDKATRNVFLQRLGKQIQEGELMPPFNKRPPETLDLNKHKKPKFQAYHSPSFEICPNKPKSRNKLKRKKPVRMVSCKTSSDLSQLPNLPEDESSREFVINKWTKDTKSNFLKQVCNYKNSESSWQDVSSNVSEYDMASGDAKKKVDDTNKLNPNVNDKIEQLFRIIEQLRNENYTLKEQLQQMDGPSVIGNKSEMQAIVNEVDDLKNKLNELLLMKSTLQTSQLSLASESQNTILVMNKKLTLLQNQNNDLRNTIHEMEEKLLDKSRNDEELAQNYAMHLKQLETLKKRHKDELDKTQNTFSQELNKKFYEYNEKLNDMKVWYEMRILENQKCLQKKHEEELEGAHKAFKQEMQEFCDKKENELKEVYESKHKLTVFNIDEAKIFYEEQIGDIKGEFEKEITCKNEEIARLECLLDEQCKRMQEEVAVIKEKLEKEDEGEGLDVTVRFLQKCIYKMDKLFKKAEKKYESQLLHLKHEIQIRERHNQILLTTERLKLLSTNSVMKQKQIDEIVNKLEQYYKKLLIEEQIRTMEEKKGDLKLISDLQGKIAIDKIYL